MEISDQPVFVKRPFYSQRMAASTMSIYDKEKVRLYEIIKTHVFCTLTLMIGGSSTSFKSCKTSREETPSRQH